MASNDGFVYGIKFQSDIKLQSSIADLSNLFADATNQFPKILPDIYKNITVTCPDPITWEVQYAKGCPIKRETIRVDEIDMKNLKISYTVIGGDLLTFWTKISVKILLIPKEEGCLVTRSYEFEKANTKIGAAFLEFDVVKLIEVDRLSLNSKKPNVKY